jgi:membrane protease YdiL (CAAX protease family)
VTEPTTGAIEPKIEAGVALAAYVALFAGFLLLGIPLQTRDAITGLWITEALAIALPAFVVLRAANVRPGPYLGLRLPRARWFVLAIVAGLLNQPVVSLLEQVAHSFLPADWVQDFDNKNHYLDAIFATRAGAMIATVTIAAPLGEELFFRGFAQPALSRSFGALRGALLTGALFALLHLDKVGFLGLAEIGVLMAVLRHASGSVWPAVLAHAVNNGIAAVAFVAGWQDPAQAPPLWFLALGGVLLLAGGARSLRLLREPPGAPALEQRWNAGEDGGLRVARAWPLVALWAASVIYGAVQLKALLRPQLPDASPPAARSPPSR